MSRYDAIYGEQLDRSAARGVLRRNRPLEPLAGGRVRREGRELINVSGNDYLGLSQHPEVIARAREWTARLGAGSGASRLITGTLEAHAAVEAKLARLKGCEAALLFASGWQLNAGVLPALFRPGDGPATVFADALIHASLHQGCAAAGVKPQFFRHNDLSDLEAQLAAVEGSPGRRFILAESVYSMDGDRADVPALAALAERFDAFLYLDEAHAFGVLGPAGAGLSAMAPGGVDLVMGTFSKAMGGFGAYLAGSRVLCDYLLNRCSSFIYTTAPPPGVLGAADAALDLVPTLDAERARLTASAERLRDAFAAREVSTFGSSTQIIPALVGDASAAVALSAALEEAGVLATAIRPPTVPPGTSRIRFSLSAAHGEAELDHLLSAIARTWPTRPAAAA